MVRKLISVNFHLTLKNHFNPDSYHGLKKTNIPLMKKISSLFILFIFS